MMRRRTRRHEATIDLPEKDGEEARIRVHVANTGEIIEGPAGSVLKHLMQSVAFSLFVDAEVTVRFEMID